MANYGIFILFRIIIIIAEINEFKGLGKDHFIIHFLSLVCNMCDSSNFKKLIYFNKDGISSEEEMLRMVVFDYPSSSVHDLPFEERYEKLLSHLSMDHPTLV